MTYSYLNPGIIKCNGDLGAIYDIMRAFVNKILISLINYFNNYN